MEKLSKLAQIKFEKVPNYLNKLAIALECGEPTARKHWKAQSNLMTCRKVILLIQDETGLSDKELWEVIR